MENLKLGLTGSATMVVGSNDTAPRVGSGRIAVLATPVMINLIEEAALDACERHLAEWATVAGHSSGHQPRCQRRRRGMRVEARAELTEIDKRKLTFRLRVHDEVDLIGEGTYTRVVVTAERFQEKVDAKAAQ